MIHFSVLICTFNRHKLLEKALTSIIINAIEKPDQIVIVNGGDEFADVVVNSFIKKFPQIKIDLIKTTNVNLATSRNIGLEHCTGNIIAMTDDDAEVFPDWVIKMKDLHHQHPEAGAIGGAVIGADSQHSFLSRLSDAVTFPSPLLPGYKRTLPGVNISYKSSVLELIGSQDESLFRGEDVDFNWRVINVGYKIFYDPEIKVIHHHRPTYYKFLYQTHMYGRAYYLVRRKWPEMYCVYPHKINGIWDMLKWAHFFIAIFYQPFLDSSRLQNWFDRIIAIPFLILNQLSWKSGMLLQFIKSN